MLRLIPSLLTSAALPLSVWSAATGFSPPGNRVNGDDSCDWTPHAFSCDPGIDMLGASIFMNIE